MNEPPYPIVTQRGSDPLLRVPMAVSRAQVVANYLAKNTIDWMHQLTETLVAHNRALEAENRELEKKNAELAAAKRAAEELAARAEELASKDTLTELYTRRAAEQIFTAMSAHLVREGRGQMMGMILLDLDHFKAVNDTHGHPAGDAVLQHVANLLTRNKRADDTVARWGGEEIIMFVSTDSKDGLEHLADQLRQRIQKNPCNVDGIKIPITASFGVTAYDPAQEHLTLDEAVRRVDPGLYKAKKNGRNCVVFVNDGQEAARLQVEADHENRLSRYTGAKNGDGSGRHGAVLEKGGRTGHAGTTTMTPRQVRAVRYAPVRPRPWQIVRPGMFFSFKRSGP